MRRAALLALAFVAVQTLAAPPSWSEEGASVRATTDVGEVAVGETLRLTVEVRGSGMSGVDPTPPKDLTNLDVVGGPSTSSQFSFVNGTVSSSKSYTWLLAPRAAGEASIPPIAVRIGDKVYRTDPIDVKVTPPGTGGTRQAPPRGPRAAAPGGRDPGLSEVRLENEVSATKVYVGQPVVLTTRLLTRVAVVDLSQGSDPTVPGFLLEETETNVPPERVFREGREYQSYILVRRILTPATPGRTTIPPEKRTVRLRARGNDPWQSFFSPATLDIERATASIQIDVLAPPREGRPPDFSGAVGDFRLEAKADRTEASVGEGIGLAVTVTGSGNLKTAQAPAFPPSADFRVFDPRVEEKASGTRPRTYTKKWSYVITPLSPGTQSLPPVSFCFFDPDRASYRRVSSPEAPLLVKRADPGSVPAGAVSAGLPRREIQTLQRDIRFLKTLDGPLRRGSSAPRSQAWVIAVIALAFLAQPIAWYAGRKGGLGALWPGAMRGRARRRALSEIARAAGSVDGSVPVSMAASRALLGFLAERCRVPAAGLTYDAIERELARRGVGADLREELRSVLELCDLGRFAPQGQRAGAEGDPAGLLGRAQALVDRLDREIGRAA